jgi:tripartite-type tricarboxylate transporter receptor subunit TctC
MPSATAGPADRDTAAAASEPATLSVSNAKTALMESAMRSLGRVVGGVAAIAAWAALAVPAAAQDAKDWPNKTVKIIVNFAPGGSSDNSMRPYAERLSKNLGQQFVLEHRGGASGAIGLEAMTKSAPDGYTFAITPMLSMAILPHLRKTPYDPLKDFVPVTMPTVGTVLFAVHPSVPGNSVQEVVAHAKANPGKLSWGTAGVGSMAHIIVEMVKKEAGVNILHVPYRGGGESLADFLAGVVQLHGDPNTFPHIASGKAKLLAVIDQKRHPDYPNVPVLKEIFPAIDFVGWFGVFAPVGTPDAIVKKMAAEMAKVAKDPELEPLLRKVALAPTSGPPEVLAEHLKKDHGRFGKIIKELGIKAE